MALPDVHLTVQDGGLGSIAAQLDNAALVIGCSSAGAEATPGTFTDAKALVAAYGYGPGVALASLILAVAGRPVIFAKADTSTAGDVGSATKVGTGTSAMTPAELDAAGPNDQYDVIVTVLRGGTIGTDPCTVSISLDGGRTSAGPYAVPLSPATVTIPDTKVKFTCGAGTLVAGDTYSFSTTAPVASTANVSACIEAFAATTLQASLIFDAGEREGADVTTYDGDLATLASAYRYARLITSAFNVDVGTEADWIAALLSDFAPVSSLRVGVGAGQARIYDPTMKTQALRPVVWSVMARLVATKSHVDAGRVADGALRYTTELQHDERVVQGLDDGRFITARTIIGMPGVFCTNPNLMAPPGSDYSLIQYGRVMDKVCTNSRAYFILSLNDSVRLTPSTGYILEKDAQGLERGNDARLSATVLADGNASACTTTVSRTDNISATKTVHVSVAVVPVGYMKTIDVTLSFVNPASA